MSNKQGFSLIEVAVLLTLLAAAGGAMYFWMHQQVLGHSPEAPRSTPSASTTDRVVQEEVVTNRRNGWVVKERRADLDQLYFDLSVVNPATHRETLVGQADVISAGPNVIFSNDGDVVIFIQDHGDGRDEGIVFYSVPLMRVIKQLSLVEMQRRLPSLAHHGTLGALALSPNGERVAMSLGYPYEFDSESRIIVYDPSQDHLASPQETGVVVDWKNDVTIRYEASSESVANGGSGGVTTQEVHVP